MTSYQFDRIVDRIYYDYMSPGDSLCVKVSKTGVARIGYIKYGQKRDTIFICSTSNCLSFGSASENIPRTQKNLLDLISLYCENPDPLIINVVNGDTDAAREFIGRHGHEINNDNPYDYIDEIEFVFKRN